MDDHLLSLVCRRIDAVQNFDDFCGSRIQLYSQWFWVSTLKQNKWRAWKLQHCAGCKADTLLIELGFPDLWNQLEHPDSQMAKILHNAASLRQKGPKREISSSSPRYDLLGFWALARSWTRLCCDIFGVGFVRHIGKIASKNFARLLLLQMDSPICANSNLARLVLPPDLLLHNFVYISENWDLWPNS